MKKCKEIIYYVYCVTLVFLSIIIIAKTGAFSRYVMSKIRGELLPLCRDYKGNEKCILQGLFPILAVNSDDNDTEEPVFAEYNVQKADNTTESFYEKNDGEDTAEIINEEKESEVAVTMGIPVETGIVYNSEDLKDFDYLVSNCYIVTGSTTIYPEELDSKKLLNMDLSIDTSTDNYKVLIYHTHGSENYADSRDGIMEDTVIGIGDELTRILEEDYGIKVYHDRNVYDMVNGKLDRSYAYDLSREAIDKILEEYPSIEVVIDLHRDGVGEDVHLITDIDGRSTAKIMFVNGISRLNVNGDIEEMKNPNKTGNLAFSLQLLLEGKKLYGDFMRNIYVTGYCYNLDVMEKSVLIEVGAQTNTVQEAKNAMIPLASILYKVLSEK